MFLYLARSTLLFVVTFNVQVAFAVIEPDDDDDDDGDGGDGGDDGGGGGGGLCVGGSDSAARGISCRTHGSRRVVVSPRRATRHSGQCQFVLQSSSSSSLSSVSSSFSSLEQH